ncbi:adrenocortical dysplasia protein homolog [Heptranchias perlo]|uniref:adrenocortical dysplasia protein homolog n=1 Tax=Heptranchias perlo TaxID=212740 RepID=UPI003559E67C
MNSHKSYIGRPWIAEQLLRYGPAESRHRPAPAQVIEFVPPENWTKEAEYDPAAVVHLSDLKHYIKAVVTKGAKRDLEQEEEDYTFSDIKDKIVILRKFNVQLRLELELKDCEFYLVVQELKILPAETGFADACSCNLDPAVQKKLRELWQSHVDNMTAQEGTFSDVSLSNLIDAAMEDEVNSLKTAVKLCLDLTDSFKASASTSSILLPSVNQTTGWKVMGRKNENKGNIFTVPEAMLMISSKQEEALNNIKEWKDDFVCIEDAESEMEHNACTDAFLHNAVCVTDGQEATSSQNPWNAVSPVHLGGIPSSGETCVSCNSTSEPCKKHVGECDGHLSSTFSETLDCRKPAIELQLPDSSTQDDPEKSVELFTEEPHQEQSHSEVMGAESLSLTSVKSADKRRDRKNVAEPEEPPVGLDEDNRAKSVNHSRTTCSLLFKNISPLLAEADNYRNLNRMGLFKNIAPVSSTAVSSHTNPNGGQCRPNTVVHNYTAAARNNMLKAGEQGLNDSEDEEPSEILIAAKRKRQFVDLENEPNGNKVDRGTSWKQTVNRDRNSWNFSSDETFIGANHFEEISNDVCRLNIITRREESCRKQGDGRNKMSKTDLRNIPENKITKVSTEYNKLVSEQPSRQVRDCRGQASSVAPIVQPTDGVKHLLSPHVKQHKDKPLRHPDGSQFLYNYPEPTAELITQVNSVRVSSGLLKWAVSYLTGPSLTQD